MKKRLSVNEFKIFQDHLKSAYMIKKHTVLVCMTGCRAYGAKEVLDTIRKELALSADTEASLKEIVASFTKASA